MLPRFLLANNTQEALEIVYIVHTTNPRCIIEGNVGDFKKTQQVHWIDPKPQNPEAVKKLLADAEKFFSREYDMGEDFDDFDDFDLDDDEDDDF